MALKPRPIAPPNPIIRAAWAALRKEQGAEEKAARKEAKQADPARKAAAKRKPRGKAKK